jgi:hypothetical protein
MPGTDATGTDFYASDSTLLIRLDFLQVRVPCAACFVVCMADIIPEAGAFSTNSTYF